jgi:hypothetical protein
MPDLTRRLRVFDRGIVSEDNLELLRQRGAHYLVGTPQSRSRLQHSQVFRAHRIEPVGN